MRGRGIGLIAGMLCWGAGLAALAAEPDALKLSGQMSGREIRTHESDRVIGLIDRVVGQPDGSISVVVQLEDSERAVRVGLDDLERQGGKFYLTVPPAEIAELPTEEETEAEAPPVTLPYGGMTPGWGGTPDRSDVQR